jgi:hypothetical protein
MSGGDRVEGTRADGYCHAYQATANGGSAFAASLRVPRNLCWAS